jgi:hypothetical protein
MLRAMGGARALVRFLALFDLGTFDRIRRRSLRQLVGECLLFCSSAFLLGPFFFGCGRIEVFGVVAGVSHGDDLAIEARFAKPP